MKFLRQLLESKKEMDPSTVTASDVATYVRQVKKSLGKTPATKSSVASAVHELIEDDPKFGSNPGVAKTLIAQVLAKLTESEQIDESGNSDIDWQHFRLANFVKQYGTNKAAAAIKSAYNNEKLAKAVAERLLSQLSGLHPNNRKFVLEGEQIDEADSKTKLSAAEKAKLESLRNKDFKDTITAAEAKELAALEKRCDASEMCESEEDFRVRLDEISKELVKSYRKHAYNDTDIEASKVTHSQRKAYAHSAEADEADEKGDNKKARAHRESRVAALEKQAAAMDKLKKRAKGIDAADKRLKESWDDEEDPDVKTANDEVRKRGIKMLSARAEAALGKKVAKADKADEEKAVKKTKVEEAAEDASLQKAKAKAQETSKKDGVVQHVRKRDDGSYYVSDWFSSDDTVATYNKGNLKEGWDQDDDEDPDVKTANDEAKKRGIKMMSKAAEKALANKLAKADKKDEDKSSKKVDESVTTKRFSFLEKLTKHQATE